MTPSCPICKKQALFEFRPFCSKRCADIDLARWLRGDYRIEGGEEKQAKQAEEEPDENGGGDGIRVHHTDFSI